MCRKKYIYVLFIILCDVMSYFAMLCLVVLYYHINSILLYSMYYCYSTGYCRFDPYPKYPKMISRGTAPSRRAISGTSIGGTYHNIHIYIYNILLYIYKAYARAKFKGICPHFCGFIWYSTSVYLGMLILYFSVVTGQRRISKGGVDRFC